MKINRPFGVEIELYDHDMYFNRAKSAAVNHSNTRAVPVLPGWKFVQDGSCGSEFVSPPMTDSVTLQPQLKLVNKHWNNPDFKKSGLHIHISCVDLDVTQIMSIIRFCRHFDRSIFSFVHPLRPKSKFCNMLCMSNQDVDKLEENLYNVSILGRFKGCNAAAWTKHGTVEFRYPESTLDYVRIRSFIDLFNKIVEYASCHFKKIKSPRTKQAKRAFLLDIIGVEDRTRHHLMNYTWNLNNPKGYRL